MCGIFGFITYENGKIDQSTQAACRESVSLLKYRGPDGQKNWYNNNCFLGFRYLTFFNKNSSIQPLHNENDTIHLICNGEIYNHVELCSKLQKHRFSSTSDCEVLIHLYEEYADDFLSLIKGQFAFALFDEVKNCIILARDRFGICPLFYIKSERGYFFASEVKALLKYLDGGIQLDIEGVSQTLFFYGPELTKTCFKNVYQVPPGSYIKINIKTKKLSTKHYWRLGFSYPNSCRNVKKQDTLEQFNFLLTQAVRRRLQGDFVPAIYTSGGLDSSALALVMSELNQKTKLFSIQFSDLFYDESSFQAILAQELNMGLERVFVTDQDILNNMVETVWHTECSLMRTAPIPMFLLSRLAQSNGYKSIISGEGADELFAGYPIFQQSKPSITQKYKMGMEILSLFTNAKSLKNIIKHNYKIYQSFFNSERKKLHYCQIVETNTKLSRYLLAAQGDRVSMANSIEQRFPYLDEDLVDFVQLLPDHWFISNNESKVILRKAMRNRLPKSIMQRPKKGYLSPDRVIVDAYIKNNSFIKQILSLNKIQEAGYFDIDKVKKLLSFIHTKNINKNTNTAFVFLLTTQILHELFVKQKGNNNVIN